MSCQEWFLERLSSKEKNQDSPKKEVINKNFFRVGRTKDNDLVCLSLEVSREHCLFIPVKEDLFVQDLDSSNGVFVNGSRIKQKKPYLLKEGDHIGIGCESPNNPSSQSFVFIVKSRKKIYTESCPVSTTCINDESKRILKKKLSKSRVEAELSGNVLKKMKTEIIDLDEIDEKDDDVVNSSVTVTEKSSISSNPEAQKEPVVTDIIDLSDESDDDHGNQEEADCQSKVVLNNVQDEPMQVDANAENNSKSVKTEPIAGDELTDPLAIVKEESDFNFSQVDVVELEDDDENMFPASQLFDKSVVKSETEDDEEDRGFSLTFYDEDDDANVVTILDSDEDEADNNPNDLVDPLPVSPMEELVANQIDNLGPPDLDVPLQNGETDEDPENPNHQFYFNKPINQTNGEIPDSPVSNNVEETLKSLQEKLKSLSRENQDLLLESTKKRLSDQETKDQLVVKDFVSMDCEDEEKQVKKVTSSTSKILEEVDSRNEVSKSTIDDDPSTIDDYLFLEESSTVKKKDEATKDKHSSGKDSSKVHKNKPKPIQLVEPHHIKRRRSKGKDKKIKSEGRSKKKKKQSKDDSLLEEQSESKVEENDLTGAKESEDLEKKKNLILNQNFCTSSEIESLRPRCKSKLVKVKVSQKSRSDMLCETMQNLRPKPKYKKPELDSKKPEATKPESLPGISSSFVIPRRQVPTSAIPIKDSSGSGPIQSNFTNPSAKISSTSSSFPAITPYNSSVPVTSSYNPSVPVSTSNIPSAPVTLSHTMNFYGSRSEIPDSTNDLKHTTTTSTILSNVTNNMNVSHSYSSDNNDRPPSPPANVDAVFSESTSNLKGVLSFSTLLNPAHKKKRVSFKENISSIKEFQIEEGNNLRNVKDGLSLRSTKKDFSIHKILDLKIEDFLARIFAWEPVWLEQQQKVKTLPPIVKKEDMLQLPNTFKNFQEYYKRMETLLLLETWQNFVKEYDCHGTRYSSSQPLPFTLLRNSFKQMSTPNGLRYSTVTLQCLVTKTQFNMQHPPVYGDMIIFEYSIRPNINEKGKMRRAFGYVVQVQRNNAAKFLRSDNPLARYVQHADFLLNFFIQTRVIDEQTVQFDQIGRLRAVYYVRPHLRLIQGLQYVPHSSLRDLILSVDIDEFQLENVTGEEISSWRTDKKLVTNEALNEKQLEAIIKFTNASVKLEPKIGLLIGPPGTGKSKVIANLVTQILYGDGRYVNGKPLRILVCAPSNAAIDEIVLRLLDIRTAISNKEHRFKMVRIGRIESMHEEVKKISVSELSKREAMKTFVDLQHKSREGIEQVKYKLKRDIDALEMLCLTNPGNRIYQKNLQDLKIKLKQISPKNPEQEEQEFNKIQNNAKAVIIQKANVIACTLSSCYTSQMETIFGGNTAEKIATCIVDEATQCCEADTLIPLMLGVKSLILVGDPNQLPATVMSTEAKKLGLDRSLFTRTKEALEPQCDNDRPECRDPVIMLNEQYRMVNPISHWPNIYFYGGKLIDRVSYKQSFPFHPYRVLNLDGLQDDIKFSNTSEAAFVGNLINCLMVCSDLRKWDKKITIGIITPYQNQKAVILDTIHERTRHVNKDIKNKFIIEVNTIDSFQGQERDVIIMSCVRSSGIGFMSDQQRLCVALTRAKMSLIICGNLTTFQNNSMWQNLVANARSRGLVSRLPTSAKPNDIKKHVISLI